MSAYQIAKQSGKQNLKRGNPAWGNGRGGNPNGRPKKEFCIPDILRSIGDEPIPPRLLAMVQEKWGPDFRPTTMRDAGMRVTYAMFLEGDAMARTFIAERTEGKVDGEAMKALFNFGNINSGDSIHVNLTALIQSRAREYIQTVRELGHAAGLPGPDGQGEPVRAPQALPVARTISRP